MMSGISPGYLCTKDAMGMLIVLSLDFKPCEMRNSDFGIPRAYTQVSQGKPE
jgi:hypothetical protein